MLKALLDENTEFVDFLLDNGVSIKAFLTEYHLRKLFRKASSLFRDFTSVFVENWYLLTILLFVI